MTDLHTQLAEAAAEATRAEAQFAMELEALKLIATYGRHYDRVIVEGELEVPDKAFCESDTEPSAIQ